MDRITLPSGGWVELRDHTLLKARDKKAVMRAIVGVPDEERPVGVSIEIADGLAAMMITAWELPYLPGAALPGVQITLLDELSIPDYDAIMAAVKPAQEALFPDAASPDGALDPASPTEPASA